MDIQKIERNLNTEFIGKKILFLDSVDSTNEFAKRVAHKHDEGVLIISEEQTAGKGRLGKNWTSNSGEGIWMSLILKPKMNIQDSPFLTLVAGAAATKAMNKIGVDVNIKWPNDLTLNRKKICGILTELSVENDSIGYIVLGMGINVKTMEFEEGIDHKATSILKEGYDIGREDIIASILNEFESMYLNYVINNNKSEVLDLNRKHSALIGKNVYVIEDGEKKLRECVDISSNGNLLVREQNGKTIEINSGEVSVRGEGGYV